MKISAQKGTIIFVHGAWHGKWCWDKYFKDEFEDHGYQVVTFDLPGHDKKGKLKGINKYSINDYVDALIKEVKQLKSAPIIVGHSMGGLVVQKYLETQTCEKAILLASVPPNGIIRTTLKFSKKWFFYPSLLTLNLYGLIDSEKKSSEAFFSKNLPQNKLTEYTEQMRSESFIAFLNMMLPLVKITSHSKIPILVMGAENDYIFSIKDNKRTAKKYNADLIIVEDIAHDMMLDVNHKSVSQQIINWLEK